MRVPGYNIKALPVLSALVIASFVSGCCAGSDKTERRKEQVIARINDYELTANDFRDEARLTLRDMRAPTDAGRAKENALDELITKKVLLQEAQRENFDKDRKFMKEIERYWEQALLKLLLKKKINEFSKKISPEISSGARERMLEAELARWVADMRKSARVRIYKENLEKTEIREETDGQ